MQIILRLSFTVSIVITNDTQRVNFTSWSDSQTTKQLLNTLIVLRGAGIDRNSLIEMNDSGWSFDEITDYIDKVAATACNQK